MSYFKRYRRSKADLQTLLLNNSSNSSASSRNTSSSESNGNHDLVLDYSNQNSTVDLSDIAKSVQSDGDECTVVVSDVTKSIQSDEDECLQGHAGNQALDDFGYIESPLLTDSDISDYVDDTLAPRLAKWSVKNSCTRACINELLEILRDSGLNLPKDSRTLLGTVRNVPYIDQCGGKYMYFGVEKNIIRILNYCKVSEQNIKMKVIIDGLPLSKSSKSQLWPILGSFDKSEVFIIAVFAGTSKPTSVEFYMTDFIQEVNSLQSNSILHNGRHIDFSLGAFICDAPARCFLKCIIGHTGYYSCERCIVKGSWEGRVVFNEKEDYPSRTVTDFNNTVYENHQVEPTPLLQISNLNCITQFALDYMHLVCLGVVKRMLTFLKQGPRICKLSYAMVKDISDILISLGGKMPSEFSRQPRSLTEIERWKATEFRQFVLYTGPLVLKSVIDKDLYQHFLTLHVSMSILLNSCNETEHST